MFRMREIYFFLAILLGSAIVSGAHAQKPKVVVLSFAGSGGSTARVQLPVFEIFVGVGPRFRDINFNVGDGSGGTEPRKFTSGAYADVGGYFLVRPLGRSNNAAPEGIVIQGDG
ncbi:MAG: hypothetical protein O7F08_04435, partial [Deltaproteobacteria bacterium]|nr:hypothetical protein [Deltaproteobacteria bacterium]